MVMQRLIQRISNEPANLLQDLGEAHRLINACKVLDQKSA